MRLEQINLINKEIERFNKVLERWREYNDLLEMYQSRPNYMAYVPSPFFCCPTIEFLKGTPFVSAKNFNFCIGDVGNCNGFLSMPTRIYYEMTSPTTMLVGFVAFSPGWRQNDIRRDYPCLDIDVMVGVY
ncbi:hypothetical protein QMJ91_17680 [Acinetobacter baumannii]|nr:hypothetical protein [Acinetobacter baumannii]